MRRLRRLLACLCLPLLSAACGGPAEPIRATDAAVEAARYRSDGPASVTLFTVRSTATGGGAHAGLMISGSERVLFDPAGSFGHPRAPERNDVHYGITGEVESVYIDYHARETYDVEVLTVGVTRAEADDLIGAVEAHGAVPRAQCALAITRVLSRSPRFRSVPVSFFPNAASRAFAALPGVERRLVSDSDADANAAVLIRAGAYPEPMGIAPANESAARATR